MARAWAWAPFDSRPSTDGQLTESHNFSLERHTVVAIVLYKRQMRNTTNRILYGLSFALLLSWSPTLRAEEAAPTGLPTPAVTMAPAPTVEAKPVVSSKFAAELYGFVEFDSIHDSTENQKFDDLAGNQIIT